MYCRPNDWSTYEYTFVLVYKNINNKKIPQLQCTYIRRFIRINVKNTKPNGLLKSFKNVNPYAVFFFFPGPLLTFCTRNGN